jgi:predicted AAA+ superfamily ATPase
MHTLYSHPQIGASWEGFAIEQILNLLRPAQAYFWATHNGAEIDLFFIDHGKRFGFEIKFNESPVITKSMRIALNDLQLDHLWVIYPGQHTYPVDEKITVMPISEIINLI